MREHRWPENIGGGTDRPELEFDTVVKISTWASESAAGGWVVMAVTIRAPKELPEHDFEPV